MAALVRVNRMANGISLKRLLLAFHQLDGFNGFRRIQMRTLRRDDNEIRAAHGIARHHGRCTLQIDNHKSRFKGGGLDDIVDDGVFGSIIDDSQPLRLTGKLLPTD